MKKPLILLLVQFCLLAGLYAQKMMTTTVKLPDGGTKTTSINIDTNAIYKFSREEIRNEDGSLRSSRTVNGNGVFATEVLDTIFNANGKISQLGIRKLGQYGRDTTYAEETNYDENGVILEWQKREYVGDNVNCKWYKQGRGNSFGTRPRSGDPGPLPPLPPPQHPAATVKTAALKYKMDLSASYSYLNISSDGEHTSFPLGAQAAFTYWLTHNIGLLADVSYHSKKDNELRITRLFLMGGMEYIFLRIQQKQQKGLLMFARLMAGLAEDRSKFSFGGASDVDKAKVLAIAAGLGIAYPISSSLFLDLIPDFIYMRSHGETEIAIRVGAGIKLAFGDSRKNY